jgi:hypothetical protein
LVYNFLNIYAVTLNDFKLTRLNMKVLLFLKK